MVFGKDGWYKKTGNWVVYHFSPVYLYIAIDTVGELRSGVTGFATIYATGSQRFLVQASAENLPHKNKYSNPANERGRIF